MCPVLLDFLKKRHDGESHYISSEERQKNHHIEPLLESLDRNVGYLERTRSNRVNGGRVGWGSRERRERRQRRSQD